VAARCPCRLRRERTRSRARAGCRLRPRPNHRSSRRSRRRRCGRRPVAEDDRTCPAPSPRLAVRSRLGHRPRSRARCARRDPRLVVLVQPPPGSAARSAGIVRPRTRAGRTRSDRHACRHRRRPANRGLRRSAREVDDAPVAACATRRSHRRSRVGTHSAAAAASQRAIPATGVDQRTTRARNRATSDLAASGSRIVARLRLSPDPAPAAASCRAGAAGGPAARRRRQARRTAGRSPRRTPPPVGCRSAPAATAGR
jgi:hypothetical protein